MKLLLPYLFIFIALSATAQNVIETEKATTKLGKGYITEGESSFRVLGEDIDNNIYLLRIPSNKDDEIISYYIEKFDASLTKINQIKIESGNFESFKDSLRVYDPVFFYDVLKLDHLFIHPYSYTNPVQRIISLDTSRLQKQKIGDFIYEIKSAKYQVPNYDNKFYCLKYDLKLNTVDSIQLPINELYKAVEWDKLTKQQVDSIKNSQHLSKYLPNNIISKSPTNDLIIIHNHPTGSILLINPDTPDEKRVKVPWGRHKKIHQILHHYTSTNKIILFGWVISDKSRIFNDAAFSFGTPDNSTKDELNSQVPIETFSAEIDYKEGKLLNIKFQKIDDSKLIINNPKIDKFPNYHMSSEDIVDGKISKKEGFVPLRISKLNVNKNGSFYAYTEWRRAFRSSITHTNEISTSTYINENETYDAGVLYFINKEGNLSWSKIINRSHQQRVPNWFCELYPISYTLNGNFYILQKESNRNFNNWNSKEATYSSLSTFVISLIEVSPNGVENRYKITPGTNLLKFGTFHANSSWIDNNSIYMVLSSGNISDYRLAKFTIK